MDKRFLSFILFSAVAAHGWCADTLAFRCRQTENWAFYGSQNPIVELVAKNMRGLPHHMQVGCNILAHDTTPLYSLNQKSVVNPKDSVELSFAFMTMQPGFYTAQFISNGRDVKSVNIAYEPQKIASVKDSHTGAEELKMFANLAALERKQLRPQFSIIKNRLYSGRQKNVYNFKMVSNADEAVEGYMAFPAGKKQLPVMITLVEEESRAANVLADFTAPSDMAELVVYIGRRGDGKECVKNMITDILLCLDFVAQREETDCSRIYIQGAGAAGAGALLCGALDSRISVSFVSDPDFTIYSTNFSLSSFLEDITQTVVMGMGLQQSASLLQKNFEVYNSISANKEYFVFPDKSIVERNRWKQIKDMFLQRKGK